MFLVFIMYSAFKHASSIPSLLRFLVSRVFGVFWVPLEGGGGGGGEGGRAYLDVAAMVTEEHSSSSRLQ